jgi:hypothetical protein
MAPLPHILQTHNLQRKGACVDLAECGACDFNPKDTKDGKEHANPFWAVESDSSPAFEGNQGV